MEDKALGIDAVESARRWLSSAKLNAEEGNYDAAIYSLEMAVEIALKSLLFALDIEVPRTHSIGDFITDTVLNDKRLPAELKAKIDGIVSTFNSLLALRPVSGYIYETKSSLKDLKTRYDEYVSKAEETVDLCKRAIKSLK